MPNPNLMPLTIFSTCKAFHGEVSTMQMNALSSWKNLGLDILLLGSDEGTDVAAKKIGATHIAKIETTQSGVPLLSSLLETAKNNTNSLYLAYINADIILQDSFYAAIQHFLSRHPKEAPVLLTARRINIPLGQPLPADRDNRDAMISQLRENYGSWDQSNAIDLFLFNRTLFRNVPDFAIGRMQWDNWLLWKAKEEGAMIIDASHDIALLHPIHGYAIHANGWQEITQGKDSQRNRQLANGHLLELKNGCTHVLRDGELLAFTKEEQQRIDTYCAPDLRKEFTGGIRYLLQTMPETELKQAADVCRTLLWRNHFFVPQLTPYSGSRTIMINALEKAEGEIAENNHPQALQTIQDVLAEKLLNDVRNSITQGRNVVIWGAGQLGLRLNQLLKRHGLQAKGFIDSDHNKQGKRVGALAVIGSSWEEATKHLGHRPYVLIGSMYVDEIRQVLHKNKLNAQDDYSG